MFFHGYWIEVSGYLHASATLPPEKKPTRYPLNRRRARLTFGVGLDAVETSLLPLQGMNVDPSVVQHVV